MTRPTPRLLASLLTLATLAACAPDGNQDSLSPPGERAGERGSHNTAPTASTTAPASATPALAVEAEGLRLFDPATGAARPLPFGTARRQTLAALANRGTPETGINTECGAGPLAYARWPDGLTLWFQQDALAGWALKAPASNAPPSSAGAGAIGTATGLTVGNRQTTPSTRADLDSAYAATVTPSTLGTEFAAGDLHGLLNGEGSDAKVTALWAGVSCSFR